MDPGTTVYLQIEGLKGKLEPRYKGPYKIVSRNKNGNYKLQDTVGHDLQRSYPLEKLKISKDVCSNIISEVEEILDDRVFKNDKQYLVKWKDYNSSHNSWESESNFVSMQPIQNYWQSKKSGKSIRSRRIEKVNIATATRLSPTQLQLTLLQIFTVLLVLQPFQAIRIHDSFTYCEGLSNVKRLDMKSTCTQETEFRFPTNIVKVER